jgi:hypothetical protein
MAFRNRYLYLPIDDLGVILVRAVGNMPMDESFERWQKIILENPARVNYAVITDLTNWSGVISEDYVYSVIAWSAQVRMENNAPPAKPGRLAWIGRPGAGLNLLTDMFNSIRADQAYHTSTAQDAWRLVLPGIAMPKIAKNFFKSRTLF